jgi:hypothetical protein
MNLGAMSTIVTNHILLFDFHLAYELLNLLPIKSTPYYCSTWFHHYDEYSPPPQASTAPARMRDPHRLVCGIGQSLEPTADSPYCTLDSVGEDECIGDFANDIIKAGI